MWLLWLRPGTTPLGATTRAVEPIGPTLGAATIRAARTTLAARTTGAARIKVCAKSIGRVHTRTDPGASSCPGAGQSSLFFPLHRLQLGRPLSAGRLGSLQQAKRLRWLLAPFDGQLGGGLHRLPTNLAGEPIVFTREYLADFPRGDSVKERFEIRPAQRFFLQELFRQFIQIIPVLGQNLVGIGMRLVQQELHFPVDEGRRVLGVFQLPLTAAAHEWITLFVTVFHHTQRGGHAVLHQHGLGDLRGHLNVGAGPGGGLTKHQLLGGPAAHGKH